MKRRKTYKLLNNSILILKAYKTSKLGDAKIQKDNLKNVKRLQFKRTHILKLSK